jgi:hypothetical protein
MVQDQILVIEKRRQMYGDAREGGRGDGQLVEELRPVDESCPICSDASGSGEEQEENPYRYPPVRALTLS